MAYTFNRNGNFSRAPFVHQAPQNMHNAQLQHYRKRTGAKSGTTKHGTQYVTGWNASKQNGLVTFLCVPYSKTKTVESKNGTRWQNWMVKVTPRMAKPYIASGMYNMNTKQVIVQELGIVISPKSDYCGTYVKRKNRR